MKNGPIISSRYSRRSAGGEWIRVARWRGVEKQRHIKWVLVHVSKGHSDFTGGSRFDFTLEDKWFTGPLIQPARHFQPLERSETEVDLAICMCDKNAFQRAMHRGQDYYAHVAQGYEWTPRRLKFGHAFADENPDEKESFWDQAEDWTKPRVSKFCSRCK